VTAAGVAFLLPAPIDTPTGGFVYDRQVIAGLRRLLAAPLQVLALPGGFPAPAPASVAAAAEAIARLPGGTLLIADGLVLTPLAAPLRQQAGRMPLIALIHHPLADETGLPPGERTRLQREETQALALAAGVIVTSRTTAQRLADFAVDLKRIAVVPPAAVTRPRARPRRRQHSAADPVRLLCVASLTPRKGQDLLLRALQPLRRLPWRLDLVGPERDRAYARWLRGLIAALRLRGRVRIHGALPAVALDHAFCAADVFALASHHEGFGMAPLEALGYGLPVVTTRAGALPEALPAGAALLVAADNRPALTAALGPLLRRRAMRQAAAARARRAAQGLRSWSEVQAEFAAVVQGMMTT
jgi:glycosyltransferase involved in cell wall biosynthesis